MIGIITLPNFMYYNYGGILQNYALSYYLNKKGYETKAIHCNASTRLGAIRMLMFNKCNLRVLKENGKWEIKRVDKLTKERNEKFVEFIDTEIVPLRYHWYSQKTFNNINVNFEKVIIGSDQVWNPNWINEKTYKTFLLTFLTGQKRVSYAASFGVSSMPEESKEKFSRALSEFSAISVREEAGADIVYRLIGKKPEVLIDPTMLLSVDEWKKVARKSKRKDGKRYLLKYFLGEQSEERRNEIAQIAKKNDLEIYEIADKDCPDFYTTGPAEFLDLFANSSLVYTDSFHATVFSILFGVPFVVMNREQNGMENMGSRIATLLKKLRLESRMPGCVDNNNLFECDYQEANKLLEEERKKADMFLMNELKDRTR